MRVSDTAQGTDARTRLGSAIRLRRNELGLSMGELARRAEMNRRYLNEVELGKRNIAVLNIEKLSRALGVPTSSLFAEYGGNYPGLKDDDGQDLSDAKSTG